MRIDLKEIIKRTDFEELQNETSNVNINDWKIYKDKLAQKEFNDNQQLFLFGEQELNPTITGKVIEQL